MKICCACPAARTFALSWKWNEMTYCPYCGAELPEVEDKIDG